MIKRSRDVDSRSNGIKFLMKKNKIDVLNGTGTKASKTVTVTDNDGKSTVTLQVKVS